MEGILPSLGPVPVFESEMVYGEEELSDEFFVQKEADGVYSVSGPFADRLVGNVNFDNDESVAFFQRTLRRRGIIDELQEAGCREGDTVRFSDIEFDYMD